MFDRYGLDAHHGLQCFDKAHGLAWGQWLGQAHPPLLHHFPALLFRHFLAGQPDVQFWMPFLVTQISSASDIATSSASAGASGLSPCNIIDTDRPSWDTEPSQYRLHDFGSKQ
jgi:hypothetical protein